MNNIEELFLPYNESLELKKLGFNEPCFASIDNFSKTPYIPSKGGKYINSEFLLKRNKAACPLYSQAFKFFRDNYKLESEFKKVEEGYTFHCFKNQEELVKSISKLFDDNRKKYVYQTYEEAELECIKQLIKIVKENE